MGRRFSRELKLAAVQRMAIGANVSKLSRELSVSRKGLYQWQKQFRVGGPSALRGAGRPRCAEAVGLQANDPAVPARRTETAVSFKDTSSPTNSPIIVLPPIPGLGANREPVSSIISGSNHLSPAIHACGRSDQLRDYPMYEAPQERTRGARSMAMWISVFGWSQGWRYRQLEAPGLVLTNRLDFRPHGTADPARSWVRPCRHR